MAHHIEPVRRIDGFSRAIEARDRPRAAPAFVQDVASPRIGADAARVLQAMQLPLPQSTAVNVGERSAAATGAEPARVVLLVEGEGLAEAILDIAQEALSHEADARDQSPERFAAGAAQIPPDELPSQNTATSHATLRTAFLSRDETGDESTLDLHLARRGPSLWEAAVFDRDMAPVAGSFPYAAPPLVVATFPFDPMRGQLVMRDERRLPALRNGDEPRRDQPIGVRHVLRRAALVVGGASALVLFGLDRPALAILCHCGGMRTALDDTGKALSMTTTFSTYQTISANLTRWQTITAKTPAVAIASAYYTANIGKVTSIDQLIGNQRLFSYAMTAFGLGDMTNDKGLMRKVLQGGVTDSKALANTLNNPKILAFATAFDFAGKGTAATSQTSATTAVVSSYVEQTLETNQSSQDTGVGLALYFQRKASSITSVYSILADKNLLTVVQTALGISPLTSAQNIDVQAQNLSSKIKLSDFQDPKKVQAFIGRFAAQYDLANSSSAGASTSATGGLSTDLLLSLQGLRLGGA